MKKLWQSLTQIYWPEIRQHFGFDTFKKAWQNIIRNPIISFSGILIISVMLIFLHISFALNFMAKGSLQVINQKIDLIAEVKIGNDQTSLEPLIQEIRKVPDLIDVKFIDENTALRNFLTRHPGIKVFMDRYQIENPLPPTLEITTKKAQSQKRIFEILTSATYQDLIQTSSITSDLEQESRWQKIISFSTIIEKAALWFVFIFVIFTILIIFNTVNTSIHHRREEIQTMHLVGATKIFIQSPFIYEGILCSLIALFSALIADFGIHFYLKNLLWQNLGSDPSGSAINKILNQFLEIYPQIIGLELLISVSCAIIGSYIAIEIYQRQNIR